MRYCLGCVTWRRRCDGLQRKLEVLVQSVESAAEQGTCLVESHRALTGCLDSPVRQGGGKRRLKAASPV